MGPTGSNTRAFVTRRDVLPMAVHIFGERPVDNVVGKRAKRAMDKGQAPGRPRDEHSGKTLKRRRDPQAESSEVCLRNGSRGHAATRPTPLGKRSRVACQCSSGGRQAWSVRRLASGRDGREAQAERVTTEMNDPNGRAWPGGPSEGAEAPLRSS